MSTEPLVLAVDDEAGILRLIKLELTTQGFRVVTASSGEEALRMAEEQRPDIALLDIVMDPEQPFSPKVIAEKRPDGTLVSKPLEDMFPWLGREELQENMLIDLYQSDQGERR